MKMKMLLTSSTLLCAFLVLPPAANAGFALRITDSGGGTVTVSDNLGGDTNGALGKINFSGTVGTFDINVALALSKPALGSAASPDMDLTYNVGGGAAGRTVKIEVTDTDFTTSPLLLTGHIGGTNNGTTTTFQTFFSNLNTEFDTSGGSSTLFSTSGAPFSNSAFLSVTGGVKYSLTEVVTVTAGRVASGDAELRAIPEPASLLLALLGVPAFGLAARLRRRNAVEA